MIFDITEQYFYIKIFENKWTLIHELYTYIHEQCIDCLLLTETWLQPFDQAHSTTGEPKHIVESSSRNACFVPEGFSFLSACRKSNMSKGSVKSGGGVDCLVDNRFKSSFVPHQVQNPAMSEFFEEFQDLLSFYRLPA